MSTTIETMSAEVAPEPPSSNADAPTPALDAATDLREQVMFEMALLLERQKRLFAD